MRKEDKQKAREKEKDIPNRIQSSRDWQGEMKVFFIEKRKVLENNIMEKTREVF